MNTLELLSVFSFPGNRASSTHSPIAAYYACIAWCKFVASYAMSFSRIDTSKVITSSSVLPGGYSLQMIRVYANYIAAQMINLKTNFYRSIYAFIAKSMCGVTAFSVPHNPISLHFGSGPQPASFSFFYLLIKEISHNLVYPHFVLRAIYE